MAVPRGEDTAEVGLPDDFTARLETSLRVADRRRARRRMTGRIAAIVPILLAVGPLVAWRLTSASPDGVHVVIASVARVAFFLDVGVHLDSAVLSSLGLQAIPTVVGGVLAILLVIQFLWFAQDDA